MSWIKWVIGGGIGGVVGAAAWLTLEHFAARQFPTEWAAIFVGILAGLGTRNAANADRIHFGRGAIAAVLALLAIVGGKYAYAEILIKSQENAAAPAVVDGATGAEDSEQADEDVTEVALVSDPVEDPHRFVMQSPTKSSQSRNSSMWVMGCYVVSGFIAYQLGKSPRRKPTIGQDAAPSDTPSTETSTGEPPVDQA